METAISRRVFVHRATLTAVAARLALGGGITAVSLSMEGCNFVDDVKHWVPVGVASFNLILNLLEQSGAVNPVVGGVVNAGVAAVQAAFNQILAAIQAYEDVTPPPQGALGKISAALEILVQNFQAFLASLNISDANLVATVTKYANIILETIAGFVALFPQLASAKLSSSQSRVFTVSGKTATVSPKERSIRQFKKDVNRVFADGGHKELKLSVSFFEHF